MTDSGTDSAANLWSVPECPFQIEASPRVLDDIRLAVVDAFFSLPRGGAEIGGILLGNYRSGRLTITGYAALDCEHAYGPSFTLSPPDEARLKTLLAAALPAVRRHAPGRLVSFAHAQRNLPLRSRPENSQSVLSRKPGRSRSSSNRTPSSPRASGISSAKPAAASTPRHPTAEITLEALPIRQVPNGVPTAAPADQPPLRRWRPEPASSRARA